MACIGNCIGYCEAILMYHMKLQSDAVLNFLLSKQQKRRPFTGLPHMCIHEWLFAIKYPGNTSLVI